MLIDVTVQGITGLICDQFKAEMLEKGPKSTNGREEPHPKEQADSKLYKNKDGICIWPTDNLLSCIIAAGTFIKVGRKQLSTRDTTIITSFLNIVDPEIPIKSEQGWRTLAKPVVNQATKGRHMCYRPLFDDWQLEFTLDVDEREVQLDTVRELVDRAGRFIGIGVMRPSRKGRYGQFKVINWKVHK